MTGNLILRLNGVTTHIYPPNITTFKFDTQLNTGDAYSITVGIQPTGQNCTVTNGAGVVGTSNVTSVSIACLAYASATLYWTRPTLNTDGTELRDLSGYLIYYGTDPLLTKYTTRIINNPDSLSTTFTNLIQNNTYYFSIASRTSAGVIGPRSNIASKQL